MKISMEQGNLAAYKTEALVVNLFEGVKKPGGATGAVDKALGGAITKLIKRGELSGSKGETAVLDGNGTGAERVIVVGLGKKEKFKMDTIRVAAAAVVKKAAAMKVEKIATVLHGAGAGGIAPENAALALAEGSILGAYKFDKYLSSDKKKNDKKLKEIVVVELDGAQAAQVKKGLVKGTVLADAANYARDLVNEPANVVTPSELATQARKLGKRSNLKVRVFNKKEIKAMKMEALLSVNRGSKEEPYLIVIEYNGNPGSKKKAAIVGKGVTFDSGGLSLKPSNSMTDMKCDMSGAAAVLGAMMAISTLKPKVNITGVIPTTDNKTGSDAQCVGDVVRASNGKTIEVLNTDAEGRLILSDAIAWAVKQGCEPIVDMATLTGACMIALGTHRTGLFSSDDNLAAMIEESGEQAGERMWRMPIDEEYFEAIKSDIADIKNVGNRYAGATTAALFLKEFTDDKAWAHLDIAGPAFLDAPQGYYIKGATGVGVRTMVLFAEKLK